MTLQKRAKVFWERLSREVKIGQGDPVESVTAFVTAEMGRRDASQFEAQLPLCLFFKTDQDREKFIAVLKSAWPKVRARKTT